jgi:hypothetical protein
MEFHEVTKLLGMRDKFAKNRYSEKESLTKLRHKLAMELLEKRDKFSSKRHGERIEIIKSRLY